MASPFKSATSQSQSRTFIELMYFLNQKWTLPI